MKHSSFYSDAEFQAQFDELVALGWTHEAAYHEVKACEAADAREYERWLDAQNSHYDERHEVDFDYN